MSSPFLGRWETQGFWLSTSNLQLSPESASTAQGTERLLGRLWLCVTNLQERLGLLPLELPLKEEEENKEEEVSGLQWPEQRTKSKNKRGKSISHGKVAKPAPAAFTGTVNMRIR